LEHGADVNALPAAKWGVTALQAASTHGMLGMAVRLLERGADVCAPAALEDGRTAIDGAAERGHLEMVQLLLNTYGDHEDLRSVCSQAADYAEREDHHEIAQWLRRYSSV
jgi:FOG: Ankyrin repeat